MHATQMRTKQLDTEQSEINSPKQRKIAVNYNNNNEKFINLAVARVDKYTECCTLLANKKNTSMLQQLKTDKW